MTSVTSQNSRRCQQLLIELKWKEGRNDSLEECEGDLETKVCLIKMGVWMQRLKWEFVQDSCSITLGGLKVMKSDTKFCKVKSLTQLLEINEAARATRTSRCSRNWESCIGIYYPVIHFKYLIFVMMNATFNPAVAALSSKYWLKIETACHWVPVGIVYSVLNSWQ